MPKKIMGVTLPSNIPPDADREVRSDEATVKLIRGRGFVLTFSSHFAVATIVGVLGWVYAQQKHTTVPDDVTKDIREIKESIAAIRSDFAFVKATRELQDKQTEQKINELFARTARL